MSLLSKIFIILVFVVAVAKLAVDATLFAQRTDWKDKFLKETNWHYQTIHIKNAEIQAQMIEIANLKGFIEIQRDEKRRLETENANKSTRISQLQRNFDAYKANFEVVQAEQAAFIRQLQVQIAQIEQTIRKNDELRNQIRQVIAEKNTSIAELQEARQMKEQYMHMLAELERNHISLAKDKKRMEEKIYAMAQRGYPVEIGGPSRPLDGRVRAADNQIGIAIISIGRDEGVREGDTFTIYRGSRFIAKGVADTVDRAWTSLRIQASVKTDDIQAGDMVSNHIYNMGMSPEEYKRRELEKPPAPDGPGPEPAPLPEGGEEEEEEE